jgi:hypothetical protein
LTALAWTFIHSEKEKYSDLDEEMKLRRKKKQDALSVVMVSNQ